MLISVKNFFLFCNENFSENLLNPASLCLVCIREYGVGPVSRLWEADEAGQDVWGGQLETGDKITSQGASKTC